jgi:hypothetical protein
MQMRVLLFSTAKINNHIKKELNVIFLQALVENAIDGLPNELISFLFVYVTERLYGFGNVCLY